MGIMDKNRKTTVSVRGTAVKVLVHRELDYISLTDIARHKDAKRTDYLISNWLRNRNTIEFLGIWERLNNPGFNPIEFDGIKKGCEQERFPPPGKFEIILDKQWRKNVE